MNTYHARILQILIQNNGKAKIPLIMDDLNITRNMFQYYSKQLNQILSDANKQQTHITDEMLCADFDCAEIKKFLKTVTLDEYLFTPEERIDYMLLMIGITNRKLFINDLIDQFNVSRNTVINDINVIKKMIMPYGIHLSSDSTKGYKLNGDELYIRYIIFRALHHNENEQIKIIKEHLITDEYRKSITDNIDIILNIQNILLESEKNDGRNYIYFSLPDLSKTILVSYLRSLKQVIIIKQPKQSNESSIDYIETKLAEFGLPFPDNERQYLYYILQSAKICRSFSESDEEGIEVFKNELINQYEASTWTDIKKKTDIYNMFSLHVRSLYYRSKYHIKVSEFNCRCNTTDESHFFIAKRILDTIGEKLNLTFDDEEIQIIGYYFACLEKYAISNNDVLMDNIIIVCGSGLGSSAYVKFQLSILFGKSFQLNITDARNLSQFINPNTKLIISTVSIDEPLRQGIDYLQVQTVLNEYDKHRLIEWYLQHSINPNDEKINEIINIISSNSVIKNNSKLSFDLHRYFNRDEKEDTLGVTDLLKPEYIQIAEDNFNWEKGIEFAGLPLLHEGIIQPTYIEGIIKTIVEYGPYCEIFKGLLLAHAIPKHNVTKPAISIATFKKPIYVASWDKSIDTIVILAVIDRVKHVDATANLIRLLSKDELFLKLNSYNTPLQLYDVITNRIHQI